MSEVSKPRLEFDKSVQDFISSFGDGKRSHLPAGWIDGRREGVDLADGVPGQGREEEVEQILSDMDHDVIIFEDSFLNCFPKKIISKSWKSERTLWQNQSSRGIYSCFSIVFWKFWAFRDKLCSRFMSNLQEKNDEIMQVPYITKLKSE